MTDNQQAAMRESFLKHCREVDGNVAENDPFDWCLWQYAYDAAATRYEDALREALKALQHYASDSSWPTRKIELGNGQSVTGFGLGHAGPEVAVKAYATITSLIGEKK